MLIELSKMYYRQLNPEKVQVGELKEEVNLNISEPHASYQCTNCLTVYDEKYGDPGAGISVGTAFENLPDTYRCHVCDSAKIEFVIISQPSFLK